MFSLMSWTPLLLAQDVSVPEAAPWRLVGDIGAGLNAAPSVARGQSGRATVIPYLNADFGAAFARIDTFGFRLAPAGYGSVELLTRVLEDGFTPRTASGALPHRKAPLPLGIGTLQMSPVGAFMANLYRDAGNSKGTLADFMYAAEIDVPAMALYPQVGLEYRSRDYVRYYDGVTAVDARQSGLPSYMPGAASNWFAALFVEARLSGHWYFNVNLRRTWLDRAVSNSPPAQRRVVNSGLMAVSYRFD
ncbi:MAG TPA: MipA/OmpV family protein [Pseudoduganella sp.]